jgi:hypothetical protein
MAASGQRLSAPEQLLSAVIAAGWRNPPTDGVLYYTNTAGSGAEMADFRRFHRLAHPLLSVRCRWGRLPGKSKTVQVKGEKNMTIRNIRAATIAAAVAALSLGSVAQAQPVQRLTSAETNAAAASAAARTRASQRSQDRRLCVRTELPGSRIVRDICHTESEWEARGGFIPEA